ncbi:MAG: O-antigen ligase family protein [Filomicrobium sp.]
MQPFSKAWWGGIATSTIVLTAIIAPRTSTFLILFVLAAAIADHLIRPKLARRPETFIAPFAAVFAFAIWAMASSLWSVEFWHSLLKPVFLMVVALAVWLAIRSASTATRPAVHYIGEGALVGASIAYILVAIEILSDQLITRSLMTVFPALYANISKHVLVAADGTVLEITISNLNRRMSILIWLFWPVMLLAAYDPNRLRKFFGFAAVGFGTVVILFFGTHQSSQVAIAGGLIAFLLALLLSRHLFIKGLIVVWAAVVLLAVPIALGAFNAGLHKADWLFHSARHRVVIWGTAADEAMRSPVVGIGADATRKAMRMATDREKQEGHRRDLGEFQSGYANHAHNAYLQVWYELGVIGALLFLAMGVATLNAISRLKSELQPITIAMFVTTSIMIAFSYSIWQTWFTAAFGMATALLAIGIRKRSDNLPQPDSDTNASKS